MNRIERLNAILIFLQSRSRVSMRDLEDRFELTRRTLFRDIRALIEAGVPIGGNAGEGYFIVEGYHLPPVVFSHDEASAILLGSKFMEFHTDSTTNESFKNALTNVRAVLRYSDKEHLDQLEEKVSVIPSMTTGPDGFPDSHLKEIQQAISVRKTLFFHYYSSYNDSFSQREVEPLGLVFYSNRWHLIAHCRVRKALRDFRADRIQKIQITANSYDPDLHPDYMEFLNQALENTNALEVIIHANKDAHRMMSNQKYFFGFADEKPLRDGYEMKFFTPSYEYLGRWLLSYTQSIKITGPEDMLGVMQTFVKHLQEQYLKD